MRAAQPRPRRAAAGAGARPAGAGERRAPLVRPPRSRAAGGAAHDLYLCDTVQQVLRHLQGTLNTEH